MSILIITGSPSSRSRSTALARYAGQELRALGHTVEEVGLHDIPANELIGGEYMGAGATALRARVARARAVLISTPIYKASFSGGLKAVLDLLDEKALADKLVLPLASGGSPAHLLAVEYGIKPVLSALGARHILAGVYATDIQVRLEPDGEARLADDVRFRLDEAVEWVASHLAPARPTRVSHEVGALLLTERLGV